MKIRCKNSIVIGRGQAAKLMAPGSTVELSIREARALIADRLAEQVGDLSRKKKQLNVDEKINKQSDAEIKHQPDA